METDTALVRADSVVELNTIADVVLHFALIVHPGYTECHDAVRLNHPLDNFVFFKFGMTVINVGH